MPDALLENHFSIFLVRPLTAAASDWIETNVSEDRQYFGNSLVVEPRYVVDLVEGMREAGLAVQL
jgi:hypothetical protein